MICPRLVVVLAVGLCSPAVAGIWADSDLATPPAANFAWGPPLNFGQKFEIGFRGVDPRASSAAKARYDAMIYAECQAQWLRFLQKSDRELIRPTPSATYLVTRAEQEKHIWAEIRRRRQANPKFLPNVPATQAEFDAEIIAQGCHDEVSARQASWVTQNEKEKAAAQASFAGKLGRLAAWIKGFF